jgi:hypothetical protein
LCDRKPFFSPLEMRPVTNVFIHHALSSALDATSPIPPASERITGHRFRLLHTTCQATVLN